MSDNIFNESPDGYSYASQELLNILDYVPSSDQDTYFDMSCYDNSKATLQTPVHLITPKPIKLFPEYEYLDVSEPGPCPSSSVRPTSGPSSMPHGSVTCTSGAKKPLSTRKNLPSFRESSSSGESGDRITNRLHKMLLEDPTLQNVCIHTRKEYHDMKSAYVQLFKENIEAKYDFSYPWTDQQKRTRVAQFLEAVADFSPLGGGKSVDGITIPDRPVKEKLKEMGLENMKDVEFNLIAWDVLEDAMASQLGNSNILRWASPVEIKWEEYETFDDRWAAICQVIREKKAFVVSLKRVPWSQRVANAPFSELGLKISNSKNHSTPKKSKGVKSE